MHSDAYMHDYACIFVAAKGASAKMLMLAVAGWLDCFQGLRTSSRAKLVLASSLALGAESEAHN